MEDVTPAAVEIRNRKGQQVAVALVDADDLPLVAAYRWRLHKGYARGYRDGESIFMHRLVLGGAIDGQVDHLNRARLDNRRRNLRVCTPAQNAQNLSARGRSGHRGVTWSADQGKWVARVQRHRGPASFRGLFDSLSDAIAAVKYARSTFMPFSEEAPCQ